MWDALFFTDNAFYARWIFLRLLGFGFLSTFWSLVSQIEGLIGDRGILPAKTYLSDTKRNISGVQAFFKAPSLLWISTSALSMRCLCVFGMLSAWSLMLGFLPQISIFLCVILFLSFVSVARNFSAFQFDGFMLELGFLAFFLAPTGVWPGIGLQSPPSFIAILAILWFSFRLMFQSGLVKLKSKDKSWRNLSALDDYYENCPFPTRFGYFAQKMPLLFHAFCVLYTFFAELILPFFLLLGEKAKLMAFVCWSFFHLCIALTANYAFLNFGAVAAAIFLLNDAAFLSWSPISLEALTYEPLLLSQLSVLKMGFLVLSHLLLFWYFYITSLQLLSTIGAKLHRLPNLMLRPFLWLSEFRCANPYGLFAVMTHARYHIIYEGSLDGETWKAYRLKWQPDEIHKAPRFMAPHLPRFDWNLWFAMFSDHRNNPFVAMAAKRLLEGEESVLRLFKVNPFIEKPPTMIRVRAYKYTFTDFKTLRKEKRYWNAEFAGLYTPYTFHKGDLSTFVKG